MGQAALRHDLERGSECARDAGVRRRGLVASYADRVDAVSVAFHVVEPRWKRERERSLVHDRAPGPGPPVENVHGVLEPGAEVRRAPAERDGARLRDVERRVERRRQVVQVAGDDPRLVPRRAAFGDREVIGGRRGGMQRAEIHDGAPRVRRPRERHGRRLEDGIGAGPGCRHRRDPVVRVAEVEKLDPELVVRVIRARQRSVRPRVFRRIPPAPDEENERRRERESLRAGHASPPRGSVSHAIARCKGDIRPLASPRVRRVRGLDGTCQTLTVIYAQSCRARHSSG
jgi:hypothetical protein